MAGTRKRELARADRVLPGVWRLRLPLPWLGVPHVNAYAIAAGSGVVLFDTGMHEPGSFAQLERALAQAGLGIEHIRLVVCTHAHSDHYGLAAPICEAAGCELWMHPNHAHMTAGAKDPAKALDRRIEVARQSGVPPAGLEQYEKSRRGSDPGIVRAVVPDRELVPGVEVPTDLGLWQVIETPGHAPSHVCLHQPDTGLLISGDHLLGRISLFFDYGHTPDPVAEFIGGLDEVDALGHTSLCLAGHGRPFRDIPEKVAGNRAEVGRQLGGVRAGLAEEPRTAFELIGDVIGPENLNPATAAWGLQLSLAYLDHMALAGEVVEVEGSEPRQWRLA
jgi:glyoxylase-like metal-dependent hydrolase (beta-lactamase superfamily II)